MTECYYVATELAKSRRNYVATELAPKKSSVAHNRVGRTKAGAHDIMALCCVAIEEAMCVRQTRPGAHDKPWAHTIGLRRAQQRCVRKRGILSRQSS